jgi:hypothetical protein
MYGLKLEGLSVLPRDLSDVTLVDSWWLEDVEFVKWWKPPAMLNFEIKS